MVPSSFTLPAVCVGVLITTAAGQTTPETETTLTRQIEAAIEKLRSSDVVRVRRAERTLVRFGSAAIQPLCRKLLSPTRESTQMQVEIMRVLRRLAPHAESSIGVLTKLRRTTSGSTRPVILQTLEAIAPYAPNSRKELESAAMLWPLREVVRLTMRLKYHTKSDTVVLLQGLEDANPYLRELAAELLSTRPDEKTKILPALRAAFVNATGTAKLPPVTITVQRTVRRGRRGSAMALRRGISGRLPSEPRVMARALLRVAERKSVPLTAYVFLLDDEDSEIVRMAVLRLGAHGPLAVKAVPKLTRLARSEDPYVSLEAITTLGSIGPAAKSAGPTLLSLASSPNKPTAVRARVALIQIVGSKNR